MMLLLMKCVVVYEREKNSASKHNVIDFEHRFFFVVYRVSNRTNAKYLHILCLNLDEYVDTLLHRRDCLARRVNCRSVCVVVLIENSINSHKFRKRRRGGKQLSARNISVAIWKFLSIISTLMDLNPIRRESQLQQKNVSKRFNKFTLIHRTGLIYRELIRLKSA